VAILLTICTILLRIEVENCQFHLLHSDCQPPAQERLFHNPNFNRFCMIHPWHNLYITEKHIYR